MGFPKARKGKGTEAIGRLAVILLVTFYLVLLVYYASGFHFSVLYPEMIGTFSVSLSLMESWVVMQTAPGVQASMEWPRIMILLWIVAVDMISDYSGAAYVDLNIIMIALVTLDWSLKSQYGL